MSTQLLEKFFAELALEWRAPVSLWPDQEQLARYGLSVRGDQVVPVAPFDPLNAAEIRAALSPGTLRWLLDLRVLPVIGSTNVELMRLAQQRSVSGSVWLAEVQLQGRGRRGRSWFSPFGGNVAVSVGLAVARSAAMLGGASLVVGLAVVDALEQLGVPNLSLKWPNDVLLDGSKLGGILIEMNTMRATGVELVVGIGLNVTLSPQLRANLEHQVADLTGVGPVPGRNVIAARIVSSVLEFLGHFENRGFAPFVEPFDARHYFHRQEVVVLQGETRTLGRVTGVSTEGGLMVETSGGMQEFHGGEVSLRQKA